MTLSVRASETLRICYEDQNYLPYLNLIEEKNHWFDWRKGMGVLPDLVNLAAKDTGLTVRFISLPWKRCIHMLEQGDVDGIFAAIWQPERDRWGAFPKKDGKPDQSKRVWRAEYPIYTYAGSELSWDGERFDGLSYGIGAPLGYVAHKKLKQLNALPPSDSLPEKGLKLVMNQRLDGYVVERSIGERIVNENQMDTRVHALPIVFLSADWYVPLSHQWVKTNSDKAKRYWNKLAYYREQNGRELFSYYSNIQKDH